MGQKQQEAIKTKKQRIIRTKEEKDHPDCYQQQVQKPGSVMVWGCVSALGKGNLHFCDGTINAEKYIEILEHNMLPSRRHLFLCEKEWQHYKVVNALLSQLFLIWGCILYYVRPILQT